MDFSMASNFNKNFHHFRYYNGLRKFGQSFDERCRVSDSRCQIVCKHFPKMLRISLFIYFSIIMGIAHSSQYHMATSQIFMDIKHNRKYLGRIVFGLFGDDAPKTVANFRQICLKGINGKTYKGSGFHRIVERFIIQGGDIVVGDGTGSISIYGQYFDDENLTIQHTRAGYLGMANRGPNTNGCQFYITTSRTQWLDGQHTIFGKVVSGQDVVHIIEHLKTNTEDQPLKPVIISKCGDVPINAPFEITDDLYGIWNWIVATGPPLGMSFCILAVFHYFFRQLSQFC